MDLDAELLSCASQEETDVELVAEAQGATVPTPGRQGLRHQPACVVEPGGHGRSLIQEGPGVEDLKHLRMRIAQGPLVSLGEWRQQT
jgi:hypothetical protein